MATKSYLAAVLTKDNQSKLLSELNDKIPNGWKTYCHHMTIISPTVNLSLNKYPFQLGDIIKIKTKSLVYNDKCMAVTVDTEPLAIDLQVQNKIPHITVATNNVMPAYSNQLFEEIDVNSEVFVEDLTAILCKITGTIEIPKVN